MARIEVTEAARAAAEQFIRRRDRQEHPAGSFDKKNRWYPSDAEWQDCCGAIRSPSRLFPYSYMTHCRTLPHVARLHGVERAVVRAAVREAEPSAKPIRLGGEEFYKAVAVVGGRFLSIFDGETEYRLGEKLTQPVRSRHGGGWYVYTSLDLAREADVPRESALRDAPRAILRVRAEGQYTSYRQCDCMGCTDPYGLLDDKLRREDSQRRHAKYAFSSLTPLEVVEQPVAVEVAA